MQSKLRKDHEALKEEHSKAINDLNIDNNEFHETIDGHTEEIINLKKELLALKKLQDKDMKILVENNKALEERVLALEQQVKVNKRQETLSEEAKKILRETPTCRHCDGWHPGSDKGICEKVKKMCFNDQKSMTEIIFKDNWDKSDVIYPYMIEDSEEEES